MSCQSLFVIYVTISLAESNAPNLTNYKKNYCSIKCSGVEHTMCKYKGPSKSCVDYTVTYDPLQGPDTLDIHNFVRNAIANGEWVNQSIPRASNMRLMVWDQELATIAHRWLSQCIIGEDKCRDTAAGKVGQNLGYVTEILGARDLEIVILGQWVQLEFTTMEDVRSYSTKKAISKFSQLIWHETYRVGCSDVVYQKNNRMLKAFGCNYAPIGNVEGKPIYNEGPPCSQCPEGTKCGVHPDFKFLCGREGDLKKRDFELLDVGTGTPQLRFPPAALPISGCLTLFYLRKSTL